MSRGPIGMRMKQQSEVQLVKCFLCGVEAPSTWGLVPQVDEPDNHLAPCGKPCMAGGVAISERKVHDAQCIDCTWQ